MDDIAKLVVEENIKVVNHRCRPADQIHERLVAAGIKVIPVVASLRHGKNGSNEPALPL